MIGNMPAVSVVMPVFNAERFLQEAIESVLNQSFGDFELIAIDDGSTDRSPEILSRYARRDSRLRMYRQSHRALPATLNFGCSLAEGSYIARMDADDIALPDRFARQAGFLEDHPRVAILGTQLERIREDGTHMDTTNVPLQHAQISAQMLEYCCLHHPTVMMRADALRSLGGYREAFLAAEDHDLWLRAAERFELANLADVLLRYRIHTQATSFQQLEQQVLSVLAAEASARFRRAGEFDIFSTITRISRESLRTVGITDAAVDQSLRNAANWYRLRGIGVPEPVLAP
jgi:glycosyltransferase involved in cell wall biosynthesis